MYIKCLCVLQSPVLEKVINVYLSKMPFFIFENYKSISSLLLQKKEADLVIIEHCYAHKEILKSIISLQDKLPIILSNNSIELDDILKENIIILPKNIDYTDFREKISIIFDNHL